MLIAFGSKGDTVNSEAWQLGGLEPVPRGLRQSGLDQSMIAVTNSGGHSAQVKMQLLINGRSIPVAQLGPDFLLLDHPFDLPPGNAELVVQVDQSERRWEVRLPNGISSTSNRVAALRLYSRPGG
jgi:hypothetical protein